MSRNRAGNKELRKLFRAIEKAGGEIAGGGNGRHWKVIVDGRVVVTISGTCSDKNAHHSVMRDLRHAGLEI